jgi:3-oxoacyl-[acyl-carrier protein] reductase
MRHALLLGGGGLATALHPSLVEDGWSVTRVPHSACEASDPDQVRALRDRIEPVDALVLTAGSFHRRPLMAEDLASWRGSFRDNLETALVAGQAFLPGMRERGWGRLVFFGMAGVSGHRALPNVTASALSKAALLGLTRAFAAEGAAGGVTANLLALGFVDSGSRQAPPLPSIPAGPGTPQDVLGCVRFLLSDQARYVNGSELLVSGGWGL